jgi:hypothetical protein
MSNKTFTVANAVQAALMTNILLPEIKRGFWKNARPENHAESWADVEIVVAADESVQLGAEGFSPARNYNFVNPDFVTEYRDRLVAAAATADPEITIKYVKQNLIQLNRIVGKRLKSIGGPVEKLPRGKGAGTSSNTPANVRRAPANFAEVDGVEVTTASSGITELAAEPTATETI